MAIKIYRLITLLSFLSLVHATTTIATDECGLEEAQSHEVNLHIDSKRNGTGKWQTAFAVHTDTTDKALDGGMVLDLKQVVIHCGGKELLQVRGILGLDTNVVPMNTTVKPKDPLFFEKGGGNTELINNKRTVKRKTEESDYVKGSAITDRPLKDNEMFEVEIDKIIAKWAYGIMLGITPLTPAEITFTDHLLGLRSGTLVYYYDAIYFDGTSVQPNYGAKLHPVKVGDRIGVMRKEDGTVHFFVNGVDRGAVTTKVKGTVYGLVDVYYGVQQATIVNPP